MAPAVLYGVFRTPSHVRAIESRPQSFAGNMGVNLGGCDAGMAK